MTYTIVEPTGDGQVPLVSGSEAKLANSLDKRRPYERLIHDPISLPTLPRPPAQSTALALQLGAGWHLPGVTHGPNTLLHQGRCTASWPHSSVPSMRCGEITMGIPRLYPAPYGLLR